MAATANLKAFRREAGGKGDARKLRQQGRVPAVIYGRGEKTRPVALDAHELERLFSRISVENTIIELEVEGERKPVRALVREVQSNPVRSEYLHIDFLQVHAGEKLYVQVPIQVVGTPAGVRAGGVLQVVLHELEIRTTPEQIPDVIELDVSSLEVGDSLHIRELELPDGISVEADGDLTVVSVLPPTVAVTEAEPTEVELPAGPEEPELVRRRAEETPEEE
jgi:large subunit ribosomal protein L25